MSGDSNFVAALENFFDEDRLSELGHTHRASYADASPFPHVVIDRFLPDILAERLEIDVHGIRGAADTAVDIPQERLKSAFVPEKAPSDSRILFYYLNSRAFLRFMEELTGTKGLIPDPYYLGGGFHITSQGGYLNIHADFNLHPKLSLERRINALLYLNRDWQSSYGGDLQLWDREMKKCEKRITPIFNRLVVFNTTSESLIQKDVCDFSDL